MELESVRPDGVDGLGYHAQVHPMYHNPGMGSSVDSSAYDPFTPTSLSGRSTPMSLPANSFDLDASFSQADSMQYRQAYTPPPTAGASRDFGLGFRADASAEYITGMPAAFNGPDRANVCLPRSLPAMPATSGPFNNVLDVGQADPRYRSRLTASPACLDLYSASQSMHSSPLMITSTVSSIAEHDLLPCWPMEAETLPNLFGGRDCSPGSMNRPMGMTPRYPSNSSALISHHRVGKRMGFPAPGSTSIMPHRPRPRSSGQQHARKGKHGHRNTVMQTEGGLEYVETDPINHAEHVCKEPECKKRFARKEHLKRHQRTAHTCNVFYQCWYCNQFSNRLDNWRDHLKRHTDHDKQTDRIKYFPEAVGRHKDEMRRVKESRKSKSKLPPGIIIIREGDPRFEEAKRAASRG